MYFTYCAVICFSYCFGFYHGNRGTVALCVLTFKLNITVVLGISKVVVHNIAASIIHHIILKVKNQVKLLKEVNFNIQKC